jgi:hypothetical protein
VYCCSSVQFSTAAGVEHGGVVWLGAGGGGERGGGRLWGGGGGGGVERAKLSKTTQQGSLEKKASNTLNVFLHTLRVLEAFFSKTLAASFSYLTSPCKPV